MKLALVHLLLASLAACCAAADVRTRSFDVYRAAPDNMITCILSCVEDDECGAVSMTDNNICTRHSNQEWHPEINDLVAADNTYDRSCRVGAAQSKYELSKNLHAYLPEKAGEIDNAIKCATNDWSCLTGTARFTLTDKYQISGEVDAWYFEFIGLIDRVMIFSGVNVYWMKFAGGEWVVTDGYPKLLSVKFGLSSPPRVDAAEPDVMAQRVYLLHDDMLYIYSWTEDPVLLEHNYTYVRAVGIRVNAQSNPFSAGPLSPLPHAPSNIDAMWMYRDALGAIVQHWIYEYNSTQQTWTYKGKVLC